MRNQGASAGTDKPRPTIHQTEATTMQTNPRDTRETARPTIALNGAGPGAHQMHPRQILARRQRNASGGLALRSPEQQAAHREICSAAGFPY